MGLFHLKTGGAFQSPVRSVLDGWERAKNCLPDSYSPMGPRSASTLSFQKLVIKGRPLGGTHGHISGFSYIPLHVTLF